MESLSIWSLAGVALNSAVIMAVRQSTQRVWHTFNYDVAVSNSVNLCHPVQSVVTFFRNCEPVVNCYQKLWSQSYAAYIAIATVNLRLSCAE